MRTELLAKGHIIGLTDSSVIESLRKTELTEKMRQLVQMTSLCSAASATECECTMAGVPCMADICGCLHKAGVQECGNCNGSIVFDATAVNAFRANVLKQTLGAL